MLMNSLRKDLHKTVSIYALLLMFSLAAGCKDDPPATVQLDSPIFLLRETANSYHSFMLLASMLKEEGHLEHAVVALREAKSVASSAAFHSLPAGTQVEYGDCLPSNEEGEWTLGEDKRWMEGVCEARVLDGPRAGYVGYMAEAGLVDASSRRDGNHP